MGYIAKKKMIHSCRRKGFLSENSLPGPQK